MIPITITIHDRATTWNQAARLFFDLGSFETADFGPGRLIAAVKRVEDPPLFVKEE